MVVPVTCIVYPSMEDRNFAYRLVCHPQNWAWFSCSVGKYNVRGKKTHTRVILPPILTFKAWKKGQGLAFYEVMEYSFLWRTYVCFVRLARLNKHVIFSNINCFMDVNSHGENHAFPISSVPNFLAVPYKNKLC